MITDRRFASCTVFFIYLIRMLHTDFLFRDQVYHNEMVYCVKVFYMVVFTLETKIALARYTVIFSVPETLWTLAYSILSTCFVHDVDGQGVSIATCCIKIYGFWDILQNFHIETSYGVKKRRKWIIFIIIRLVWSTMSVGWFVDCLNEIYYLYMNQNVTLLKN